MVTTSNKPLALRDILDSSEKLGLPFITDQDARPLGGAHPSAHLWDNGSSPIEELNNLLEIRKVALNQMDLDHLKEGETYTQLEDRLVPIYLLHRYQVEAVSKLIGGLSYEYGVKGAKTYTTSFLDAAIQRNALSSFLKTLYPKILLLPKKFLSILPPRSFGNPRGRESFKSQTGVAFDHLSLAETLTSMQLKMLLHPERINRLIQQTTFDPSQLGFEEVLTALYENIFEKLAVKFISEEIVIVSTFDVSELPVQPVNSYPSDGEATTETTLPEGNVPPWETEPPRPALDGTVNSRLGIN